LQFKCHVKAYYSLLCDLVAVDAKEELKALLRTLFKRIGVVFNVADVPQ
jgi:hypothetical protein